MKTTPGKFADYESLLHNYSKKIYDYLIQQGNGLSWSTYEVLMPSGTSAEYNVVGVTVSDKIDNLLDPGMTGKDLFAKALPNVSAQEADSAMKKFAEVRSLVKREIYMPRASTNENGPPTKSPAKYVQVDYMTPVPGKEAQYAKMESDVFGPVHKQRMALNVIKGWGLFEKIMPVDSNDPVPYIAVNFHDDFAGMLDGKYVEAIKKAMPNQDINKLVQNLNAVKKAQRSEVWKLVEYDSMQGK